MEPINRAKVKDYFPLGPGLLGFNARRAASTSVSDQRRTLSLPILMGSGDSIFPDAIHACNVWREIPISAAASAVV